MVPGIEFIQCLGQKGQPPSRAAGGVAGWFLRCFGVCAIYALMQFHRVAKMFVSIICEISQRASMTT